MHMDMGVTDEQFLQSFDDMTLQKAEWTHRAHVKVAFLYLSRTRSTEPWRRCGPA